MAFIAYFSPVCTVKYGPKFASHINTFHTGIPHISFEYCLIVLSVENLPILGNIEDGHLRPALSVKKCFVNPLLALNIRFKITQQQILIM